MGNVLGWFGLKKTPPSPKASRRDRSPPQRSEQSKCQEVSQSTESCTSNQSLHQSTLQVTLQPKPKNEDSQEAKEYSPPKADIPTSVPKPATVTIQPSPKQERGPPPVRPPAPKYKAEELSKPTDIASRSQENVQSLANRAKEEVKNLTENISKTTVDSAESLVKITSSAASRTTTLIQEATQPSAPSIDASIVQTRTAASNELLKNAEPFEMVSICPVVAVCHPCIDDNEVGGEDSHLLDNQETVEEAAVKIQAGIRGYLTRKALKDRFSPAPESLIEKQTETSQTKLDTETEKSTSKTSTERQETPVKVQGATNINPAIIASKAQETPTHGRVLQETSETISNLNTANREKIPIKPTEPLKKEEASARPAELIKAQAQPQNQVAESLAKPSQIVRAEVSQHIITSKVSTPLQEDEEDWDEDEEEDEYEEEDIMLEEEEPTPPASPPTQIKKQIAKSPGAPSSTGVEKH